MKQIEEKLRKMGLEINDLKDRSENVLAVLSEITDKEEMESALLLTSVSKINQDQFCQEEIKALLNTKYPNHIRKLLCYGFLTRERLLFYHDLLEKVEEEYLATCMVDIMSSQLVQKAQFVDEALNLLSCAEEDFQRTYARNVLINGNAIQANLALPLAKLIINTKREYNARNINNILLQADIIENSEAFYQNSCYLKQATFEEQSECMMRLINRTESSNQEFITPFLNLISNAKEDYHIRDIETLFQSNIDPLSILLGIKAISSTATEEESKRLTSCVKKLKIYELLPYLDERLDLSLALEYKITNDKNKVKRKTIQ